MLTNRNKTALCYKGISYSYTVLLQHIARYAENFRRFENHRRVILYGENSAEWIFAFYGTLKNNGIAIPVDVQCSRSELQYILSDSDPHIIFTSEDKKESVENLVRETGLSVPVIVPQDISLDHLETLSPEPVTPVNREDTALIIYTSGTTGSSKGVMLSYENMFHNLYGVCHDIRIFREELNTMVLLPTHHIFPLLGSIVAPLYSGGTIYIAENLATDTILQTLREGKISIIIGVPRLYEALSKGVMEKINASWAAKTMYKIAGTLNWRWFSKKIFASVHEKFGGHIQYLVSGGAALPVETGSVFKTLGFEMLEGYGMTETSPLISFTHPGKWKLGYAGYPLTGMELKIEEGEVCIKGPNVMQGYYNRPEETDAVIKEGWLHTGDLGLLNQYGLRLTGRKKEIIVTSNGKNIDPVELEKEFYRLASYVKEVGIFMHEEILQAVIFPDMNQIRDKSVQALPELIKDTVISFNNNVPSYKRIKRFHITSEELPKTRMGKIQRFKLPELAVKEEKGENESTEKIHGEQYWLLKAFVEKETGMTANENSHFEIDLAMDSLSRIALLAFIGKTFGLSLTEEVFNELNTLGKLNDYIEKNRTGNTIEKKVEWKDILTEKISDMTLPTSGITNKTLIFLLRNLLKMIYRYQIRGLSNIPNEPCILVANHQSMLDGVLLTSTLKRKINKKTYLFAKEKHWKNRIMNFLARKNNVILMDINHNVLEGLQKLSYVLKNGKNVIIFPEGTRSKEGIRDFKDTFAILSKELNVPIVPVVIQGTDKALYDHVKLPRYSAPLSVDFLETVHPRIDESYNELKNRVRNMIASTIEAYRERKKK